MAIFKRTMLAYMCLVPSTYCLAEPAHEFAYTGFGAKTCAAYADDMRSNPQAVDELMLFWMQGFLSGINAQREFDNVPVETIPMANLGASHGSHDYMLQFVHSYCDQHPLTTLVHIGMVLYLDIAKSAPPLPAAPP